MCLSCVLACQIGALGLADPRDLLLGQKPPRRLSLGLVAGAPHASLCRHCVQAPCAEACISGSMVRDEAASALLHHPETCVGCGTCQLVCPFNAISRSGESGSMAKCNLCLEEGAPPCVGACRTGALVLGDRDRDAQARRRKFAEEMTGGRKHG
jgi:carbon-monoxide dehydrogenase iron sulfur subunit